jgi:hypothetical protein
MGEKPVAKPEGFPNEKLYLWVKGLEGKVNNMVRELDVLKNDFAKKTTEMKKEMKTTMSDVLELQRQHDASLQKIDLIIKELKRTAGSEELQVLKKYIDFWNPMHFVTQRDLERALDLHKHGKKEKHKYTNKHIG